MTTQQALQGMTGSFVSFNDKRYYVGNIFDSPCGHDGEYHPVVRDFGVQRLFGNFGNADGSEYKTFRSVK